MRLIKNILSFPLAVSILWMSSCPVMGQVQTDTIAEISIPEVTISALRLPFKESTVPYSISLMNTRNNTRGLSLSENIAGLPGLEVNARYNYAVGDRITNRGFGARTQFGVRGIKIVFDDMPVTFADGQSNLEMIDLQNLSYIEFLRGPGSSLYGNSSGGILLIHSKPVGENRFLSSVSSTAGSDGLLRLNGLIEGRTGNSEVSLTYTNFRYSGFRDHASAEYNRAFLKFASDLSPKDNILIEAGFVKFDALNPGSLTRQEFEENPEIANPLVISNEAGQDGKQAQISGTWKHQSDSISNIKLTVYGIHRSVVNPIIGKIIELPQYSAGMVAFYNSKFTLGSKLLDWSIGTEIAMRFNDRKNYVNDNGQKGSMIVDQDEQVLGGGVFFQVLLPATEKLNIDACLRYDLTHFGVQNHLQSTSGSGSDGRTMKALNPSLGLIFRIAKSVRIFANISTSFETPTSTELVNTPEGTGGFNPDLNPSRAFGYEFGLRGYLNAMLTYDLAAYIIHTRDELIPFQVPSAPGQDYYRNAGSTLHRGGEATLRFVPFSFMELSASLTYTDASYKDFVVNEINYSGNSIPGISLIHGVAELKVSQSKGYYLSLLLQNFGKMYVNDANSAYTDKYGLIDLGLGSGTVELGKTRVVNVYLSGGISNIFNRKYVSAISVNAAAERYYEPGPGRTFFINARFEFGVR
jgi:iron complex outermembrane receptor protein